jgi:two-component system, response regulator PdtaR
MTMDQFKILIVEDEIIVAMEIELELQSNGYNVIGKAYSNKSAVDISVNELPDIVLMDVNLRGKKNGIETAKDINQKKETSFIFISAYTDEETRTNIMQVPNSYFLPKPFTTHDLITKIDEVILILGKNSLIQK